ncbi:MAG: class I SAM-dependent methyltransferase [Chloroflexota bacterium]|nr:MAG: class I SAM-dependent methyltransferase [Chloroflexota bacterium]
MTVKADPEGISIRVLRNFIDLKDKRLLEVGCGAGRLTFPLAQTAGHITAIDPCQEDLQAAIDNTPRRLAGTIEFLSLGIEDYELPPGSPGFDIGLFTWSL